LMVVSVNALLAAQSSAERRCICIQSWRTR
jgi:hypothetical protein